MDIICLAGRVAIVVLFGNNIKALVFEQGVIDVGWSNKHTLTKMVIDRGVFSGRFSEKDEACMGSSLRNIMDHFWASQCQHHICKIFSEIFSAEVTAIPPADA